MSGHRGFVRGPVILAACFTMIAAPARAAPELHVIPFPGTPDASPSSQIIFPALKPSELRSVSVIGSSSGSHEGRVVPLPDRAGTAFIPKHPFRAGEAVSVRAELTTPTAGTASGSPGATALRFSFTVATPPSLSARMDRPRSGPFDQRSVLAGLPPPVQHFHSAPALRPTVVTATADPDTASGDIFVTPQNGGQQGPMILDGHGRLVWFRHVRGIATNLEVQEYRNQPVLTWFQQINRGPVSYQDVVMNRAYRVVGIVRGIEGYVPDLHEFQLTSSGTAWLDAYTRIAASLTKVGGSSKGVVVDCVIQERDVSTGQLLWEWHSLGHIPLRASFMPAPTTSSDPYDYFHLNSIQQLPGGNLLISARHTWSVYEIDRLTGRVIWTLGGRRSSFRMTPGARFEWQHDARLRSGRILTLFDDAAAAGAQEEPQSSAKVIRLNPVKMTASLVHRYTHRPPLLSKGEGGAQLLPNHNVFVGWGNQPMFTEFTSSGRQVFNGTFPLGVSSYRAYRFRWDGRPATRPSVAVVSQAPGEMKVYASWNGATDVAAWRVKAGAQPKALRSIGTWRRTGFETVMSLGSSAQYVAVQAVNARGKVIGTSDVKQA